MVQRALFLLLLPAFIAFSTTQNYAQVIVTNERGVNTAFQEYSPTFYQKGLVFIASNPAVSKDKKEDTQLGKSTTSIFLAKRGNDGNLQRPVSFAEELTTKFYDGPLSFNATGDIVFFTRTNLKKGKPRAGKDGLVKLKIYSAKLNTQSGKWGNIEELPFNDNDFDCMHPSVSADGQRLYFVSNRSGGKGGLDIYVSFLQNGKWGEPTNLGPSVNTAKDEVFPFIHADNTLYFATNGRKSIGNFDIFWTQKTDEGWLEPKALPEPINSSSNDFGIIVADDKQSGFFSSNRASGQGDDDIFSFSGILTETETATSDVNQAKTEAHQNETNNITVEKTQSQTVKEENTVKGQQKISPTVSDIPQAVNQIVKNNNPTINIEVATIDKMSNKPIQDVKVSILNMKSIKNATFMTDATGKVTGLRAESGASIPLDILPSQDEITDKNGVLKVPVVAGERFLFNFSKEGFESKYVVKTIMEGDNKVAAFMSKVSEKPIIVNSKGLSIRKDTVPTTPNEFEETRVVFEDNEYNPENYSFELKGVYYGHGDAEVSEEVKQEVEPLLKMMQKDKKIEIEIASHTDSKAKAAFNLTLSQLRADNIKTHFVENGISPDRIRALGYGETMLRNHCKKGVNCSEDEHAQNRRTSIKVVKGIETQAVVNESKTPKPPKSYNSVAQTTTVRAHTEEGDFVASNNFNVNNVATTTTAEKKHFHVVIGTFTRPENAQKHQRKAIDAGFVEAEVLQDQATFLYTVSVRLFSDQKEARKLADYINEQKEFEAFVKEWK